MGILSNFTQWPFFLLIHSKTRFDLFKTHSFGIGTRF